MNLKCYLTPFVALLFSLSAVRAQSTFNASLTGNPVNTTGWVNYGGNVSGDEFVLTNAAFGQSGAIFYNTPTNLTSCASFTVSFEYRISDHSALAADGLAFWYISNPPTTFTLGGNIGIPANPNGLLLVFDTYENASPADVPLIGAYGLTGAQDYAEDNPTGQIGALTTFQTQILNGNWHTVVLTYNNGILQVVHDNVTVINAAYSLSQTGYFGFSAATGGSYSRHALRNVNISAVVPPPAPTVPASTVTYCQGATPAQLTATGTNLRWFLTPTGGTGDPVAPTPSTSLPGTTIYYVAQLQTGSCAGPRTPITVNVNATPATPSASSNSPVCQGSTIQLNASNVPGVTYSWTGPGGYTATVQNPTRTNAQPAMAGTYSVIATLNNCPSAASGSTSVSVLPTPAPVLGTVNNPTTCGGTNGSITFSNLTPGTSYGLSYVVNTVPVSVTVTSTATGSYVLSGLVAGSYTNIIFSTAFCSSVPLSPVTLSNPATPATPVVTATPNPVCTGFTVNFSTAVSAGLTFAWSGPSSFTSTSATPSISNVTTAAAGTYSVVVTNAATNCSSAPGTVNVTVNNTPAVTGATPTNPSTCGGANGSIALAGLANSTAYTATYLKNGVSATFSGTSDATGNLTVTGLTAGTYTNAAVTASGCSSAVLAGPIVLTNPTPPPVPTAASNTPVCTGNSIDLTAAGSATGFTYSWTGPASFTSAAQNPSRPNATVAMAGAYTVTVTNTATLCTNTSSITVVVNPTPATPTASNNGPVCQGTTLSLTTPAVTGGSWTWTGPNAFTSTAQNPNIASATPAATGVYSVVLRVLNCPSLPGTTTALVNPLPVAPTTSPVAYCQFETAVPLTANGTGPLRWYTVATGGTALAAAPTPNTALPSVTTWYVSQLSAAGCQGPRASLVVTVKAKPAVPVIAQPLTTYCQYAVATPLVAVGQGLLYYTTATGGTAQTFILPSTAADGTFNYYASQTVNGCESDRSQFTVIVKPKPAPPLANSPQSFCQGTGSQPLTAIGQSLLWYTVPAGGQPQAGTPLISTTNAPDSANWYVTQTVDGCQSDRAYVKAVVNYRPVGQIRGARLFVCDEDTLTLYYSGTGQSDPALSYFWSSPVVTATPYAPSAPPYGPSIIYQFHTNGPYPGSQVQLIVDNRGCQSSVLKYNVEVRELPILGLDAPGDACVGAPVTIGLNSVSLPNTDTFNWYGFAGAQIIAGQNAGPYSVSWSTAGTKYLMVQGYRRGCWSDTTADTIEIYPRPTADIEFVGATSVCIGDSIKLRAFYDPSYSYSWAPSRFFDTARNADAEMLAHIYSSSTIRLTVTGPGSCTETDTVNIEAKPCCEVFVPSGFTPNGDGKNDIFRAITKGHHPVEAFRVVNRWGNVVFDAANTNDGWDGSAYGDAQPTGTYFYYIKYKCATGEFFEKKGEVTLIR